MPAVVIVGTVCLVIGVALGAVFSRELYEIAYAVREWTIALLCLAGIGVVLWAVLHFGLHAI